MPRCTYIRTHPDVGYLMTNHMPQGWRKHVEAALQKPISWPSEDQLPKASEFDRVMKMLKVRVSISQREAAYFLESRGYQFMKEFGYENCCERALSVLEKEGWLK